ncbi:hypothetical protein L226DRAFT_239519 [Lentinus tigrinus ALCF2SS1-7]|uniref:Uncharacterized protein n=1 Tax=Lentinus tigrinus ALCF2SS1-6 TaxID=1328759 RepID=A0A5C2SPU1_9APHY|nr:hypothetical protein L227DRAFT_214551 [Lentinus tigrinus ALCF2SS1-6]RPD79079.1 hypothetical protein L226DRAFT_239519 [Lentinus tigrinus ALCF2SS1-7]
MMGPPLALRYANSTGLMRSTSPQFHPSLHLQATTNYLLDTGWSFLSAQSHSATVLETQRNLTSSAQLTESERAQIHGNSLASSALYCERQEDEPRSMLVGHLTVVDSIYSIHCRNSLKPKRRAWRSSGKRTCTAGKHWEHRLRTLPDISPHMSPVGEPGPSQRLTRGRRRRV